MKRRPLTSEEKYKFSGVFELIATTCELARRLNYKVGIKNYKDKEEWDGIVGKDWRNVVYIKIPDQPLIYYHIHDKDLHKYAFLPEWNGEDEETPIVDNEQIEDKWEVEERIFE
jgi:hypothetical protein